jgi:hypothetical protein
MTRAWPFMTQDERMQPKPSPDPVERQDEPESAHCECNATEVTIAELESGRCADCGKLLIQWRAA